MSLHSENKQRMLYHYTTQAGIIGICLSKTLWASSIHHLNDRQEFNLGLDLAKEAFEIAGRQKDEVRRKFCAEAATQLDRYDGFDFFVVSFSEKRDSLSQWRGYGEGSAGVAIGFTEERLTRMTKEPELRFHECVYEPDAQQGFMSLAVKNCLAHFESLRSAKDFDSENFQVELFDYVRGYVAAMAPFLKHQSFKEEEEWRLVLTTIDSANHKVRPGADFMVPYVEIDLLRKDDDGSAFDEIVIGPNNEPLLATSGLQALLTSTNCRCLKIDKTSCPFRA